MRPLWCFLLWVWTGTMPVVAWSQTQCDDLAELRMAFLDHTSLEQAMESKALAESKLEQATDFCAIVIEAHRWVSLARSADFEWNPATKLKKLQTGLDNLNLLVLENPTLDILKALRLCITGTAPRFLGVNGDWTMDRQATARLLADDHWRESPKFSEWMRGLMEQTR